MPWWTHQDPWPNDGPPVSNLTQCKAQCKINDNGKDDHGEGTNSQDVGVNCDRGQEAGGEGNNGNNDGCLCHRLCFFLGKFHTWSQWQRGKCKIYSRESVGKVLV